MAVEMAIRGIPQALMAQQILAVEAEGAVTIDICPQPS